MSDYIDLKVVGQVIAAGVVLGAGLPLVFAAGLRALSPAGADSTGAASYRSGFVVTRNPAAIAVAILCFAVVAASVAFGIYLITHKS
jgi:hypothetical protein